MSVQNLKPFLNFYSPGYLHSKCVVCFSEQLCYHIWSTEGTFAPFPFVTALSHRATREIFVCVIRTQRERERERANKVTWGDGSWGG